MKVLVLGTGISGRSAYDFLLKKGYEVEFAKNEDINSKYLSKDYLDRLFYNLSFIVISPGIAMDSYFVRQAKKRKFSIIGEFELGVRELKSSVIAVTGTNGKTTTVSLIAFLLKNIKANVFLGGNVGVAVTSFAGNDTVKDVSILECSSFQLESLSKFSPHIAVMLNITEDHLNRHKTMERYIACKQRIVRGQTDKDFLIVNADSILLMQNIPKTKAKIFYFSTKRKVVGCYVKRNSIYFNDSLTEKKLVELKNIKLVGEHNLSNILASVLAVYLQTGDIEILKEISKFQCVEHRIEYVKTIKEVMFFNDSKATNIDSTLVALKSFSNGINLILGGSDKGYDFDKLFSKMPKNVKNITIFGQTRYKIALSAKKFKFFNVSICADLRECVLVCFEKSSAGDVVLLSPACASFDCFSGYEERGRIFKKIVKEIMCDEDSLICQKEKIKV